MRPALVVVLSLILLAASEASAQERRLTVLVADPSGATIPRASIIVLAGSDLIAEQAADAQGVALITVRTTQPLTLIVTAPGFATEEVAVTFPVRATAHQVTVSLALANIETDVTVSAAEQAEAGGLTETLSQAEIDQLLDDPDELQRMLEEIAGPGATIRVDGFSGGRLPTRDQIARVVVRRDAFSAEFHDVGRGRVEIATRPGVDRWRGNAGLNVRPSRLSARNAAAAGRHDGSHERVCGRAAGPQSGVVFDQHRGLVIGRHPGHFRTDARGPLRGHPQPAVRQPERLRAHRGPADAANDVSDVV